MPNNYWTLSSQILPNGPIYRRIYSTDFVTLEKSAASNVHKFFLFSTATREVVSWVLSGPTMISRDSDEMKILQKILQNPSMISDESSSDEENHKETVSKSKKRFVAPVVNFTGNFPATPNQRAIEPIGYFYFMFGEDSIQMLNDQLNLCSGSHEHWNPAILRHSDHGRNRFVSKTTIFLG